jgi:hypothetical protein
MVERPYGRVIIRVVDTSRGKAEMRRLVHEFSGRWSGSRGLACLRGSGRMRAPVWRWPGGDVSGQPGVDPLADPLARHAIARAGAGGHLGEGMAGLLGGNDCATHVVFSGVALEDVASSVSVFFCGAPCVIGSRAPRIESWMVQVSGHSSCSRRQTDSGTSCFAAGRVGGERHCDVSPPTAVDGPRS